MTPSVFLQCTQECACPKPKLFASMRFHGADKTPMKEAGEIKELLDRLYGIEMIVVHVDAGNSILDSVFADAMPKCVGFVAMGSIDYGEKTENKACSYYEAEAWISKYKDTWGPVIPVRLIGKNETIAHEMAQEISLHSAIPSIPVYPVNQWYCTMAV